MKRAVALILLVCLALAIAVAGYLAPGSQKAGEAASPTPAASPLATATPEAGAMPVVGVTVTPTPRATAIVAPTQFPGAVAEDADPAAARYKGTWDTIFGKMTFTVNGRHVHGEYPFEGGIIEATLSDDGKSLVGKWYEKPTMQPPQDAGKCTFTISEDGNVIHGEWWYGEGEYGGVWDGVKIS